MQKYEVLGVIGQGAYGVVMRCRNTQNNSLVAIKKFKQTEDDQLVRKTTIRQVKLLRMLSHPNIVELKEAFRKKGIVCLVFQYLQYNLLEVLEKSSSGLPPERIKQLLYQIIKGIAYLHSMDIVHRDIKPENLLVGDKNQLKICDFGFARQMGRSEEVLTDYVATRWYRAPELLVGAKYGKEVDIWAIGCIFGELVDGMPMFPGENQIDQLFLIQKCIGPLTPDHYEYFLKNQRFLGMKFPQITILDTIQKRYIGKLTPKALSLLKCMLRMNPSQRLTAAQALKHPYFEGIREDGVAAATVFKSTSTQRITKLDPQPVKIQQPNDKPFDLKTVYSRIQIRRQGEHSGNLQQILSKSVGKNLTAIHKSKNKAISLQKHHNKDILMKTQNGFFFQPTEIIASNDQPGTAEGKCSRNKIYGVNQIPLKQKGSYNSENLERSKISVNIVFSNNTFNYRNS